jgi:anti-sigma factor RsiW
VTTPIGEDDLTAWVDDRLTAERRHVVELYLADHPEIATRLRQQQDQRTALRSLFGLIAAEPVPATMRIEAIAASRSRTRPAWFQAVAAALLLAVGFGGGWGVRTRTMPPQAGIGALAREAGYSYRVYASDAQRPAEMGASEKQQLVSWASRRIGSRVAVPDLAEAGYHFAGGRLVATPHGPALLLLYDGAAQARLAVLSRPMDIDKDASMVSTRDGDVQQVSWADRGIGFSVVAPSATTGLQPIAAAIRGQAATT